MDMWEPYVQSTLNHVPGAAGKIVHDPFHLVKYMNEAVTIAKGGAGADALSGVLGSVGPGLVVSILHGQFYTAAIVSGM